MGKRRTFAELRRQIDLDRGGWESDIHRQRLAEAQVIARQRSARVIHEIRQLETWLSRGLQAPSPSRRRFLSLRSRAHVAARGISAVQSRLGALACADGARTDFTLSEDVASKLVVVDYRLPALEVVPHAGSYKVDKNTADVVPVKRPAAERNVIYQQVVAQVTLRCLHEIFGSLDAMIDTVVFNGFVESTDVASGHLTRACLVSVRVTREQFLGLDLQHVDAVACLRALHAAVSPRPSELVAVAPIMQLNLDDSRFVNEQDVLSQLETRPNLLELTPGEFESLITNLFTCMGLETRLTQPSRDGGVDCVAFDLRPVLGGKVVIQAKRYANTVGVSAVRDLYGTVLNEGAGKGILVTTSGFGPAAFDFASGKPLELLSGANLLALLKEWAGIDARIVPVSAPQEDFTSPSSTSA